MKYKKPYGFALLKVIYLNSKLQNVRKKGSKDPNWVLKRAFHHEYYHLMHNHKGLTLLMRFFFSFVPLFLIWHWIPFVIIYVISAYGMHYAKESFEDDANFYAEYKMTP